MAHELSFTRNAIGDAFFVGQSAWHQHGTVLASAPTMEEALRLGGLDFSVETRPLFYSVADGADFVEIPNAYSTYRTDSGQHLGIVGKRYHALQNKDAFGVLEPLLDSGVAQLETGGTLREGADVWMLVKFNIDGPAADFFAEERIVPFGLITNNHSGRSQVMLAFTPVRVVCANTLGAAVNVFRNMKGQQQVKDAKGRVQAVKVRHTSTVKSRTVDAAIELFGQVSHGFEQVVKQYQILKATQLDAELFERLVLNVAAPLPKFEGEQATARRVTALAKAEAKRADLKNLWTAGKGHVGDLSAWEAYNGVVESVDHDAAEVWQTRGESRLASLYDGGLGEVKQNVLEALMGYAVR